MLAFLLWILLGWSGSPAPSRAEADASPWTPAPLASASTTRDAKAGAPRLVVVTLTDGQQLAGQLVYPRRGSRPWLRIEGAATVLWRPLPNDRVARIEATSSRPRIKQPEGPRRATDAELAHRLLFGVPAAQQP